MPNQLPQTKNPAQPPKPRSEALHPELSGLPRLTPGRRRIRSLLVGLLRRLVRACTVLQARGLENIPRYGPALFVSNHLGDADLLVGLTISPRELDTMAKVELYEIPVLGWLMKLYGIIWVHRGQADRGALRAALQALSEGRAVVIAPEGRESLTGALEEGTGGAAYLALRSGAPVVPVTLTGTENRHIFANLKRLRRSAVTLTIGEPFVIGDEAARRASGAARQAAVRAGTQQIMETLARQLPPEYRGAYGGVNEGEQAIR